MTDGDSCLEYCIYYVHTKKIGKDLKIVLMNRKWVTVVGFEITC